MRGKAGTSVSQKTATTIVSAAEKSANPINAIIVLFPSIARHEAETPFARVRSVVSTLCSIHVRIVKRCSFYVPGRVHGVSRTIAFAATFG